MSTLTVAPTRPTVRTAANAVPLAWREARPVVQFIFQLRFAIAALLAVRTAPAGTDPGALVAGAAGWLCATWHVYLLNGLRDRTEDRHNASARPLARGALRVADARAVLTALAALALGFGALAGWRVALLTGAMLVLGVLYSAGPYPLKASVPGAMSVITAGGLATYLAGWYAAGGATPGTGVLTVAVAMSLWMSLAGMTKDLPDVAGDRIARRRTLPILLGVERARLLIAALTMCLALAVAGVTGPAGTLVAFGAALLIGAATVVVALVDPRSRARRDPRAPYRRFMVTQYCAHLVLIAQNLV